MSLHDHLVAYAIDQYRVSGEWYVIRCLRLWEAEYGKVVATKVRVEIMKRFKLEDL